MNRIGNIQRPIPQHSRIEKKADHDDPSENRGGGGHQQDGQNPQDNGAQYGDARENSSVLAAHQFSIQIEPKTLDA